MKHITNTWGSYLADGKITRVGMCPPGEEANQLISLEEILYVGPCEMGDQVDPTTGKLIELAVPVVQPSHSELRRYPTIEWQLDALWHAMDSGELPKATKFYDAIKGVKAKHPKPIDFVLD